MAKYGKSREPAQPPHKLPVSRSTQQAFQVRGSHCQNIGLIFDRYLHFTKSKDCDWDMGAYSTGTKQSDTAKSWNLNRISNINIRWRNCLGKTVERWQHTVKSQHAAPFIMTPEWRFAVGLGEKNALENGLTFHRIYGFPIIPGSALKGLARAVALWEIAEALGVPRLGLSEVKQRQTDKKKTPLEILEELLLAYDERIIEQKQRQKAKQAEDKALRDLRKEAGLEKLSLDVANQKINQFRHIFGTQHATGEAMFFEAMPAEAPQLEVDVMNVHYPDYYKEQSTKPPSDNQNPTPIFFLTIGRTPFWFAVGWRGHQVDTTLQQQAITWLKHGLKEFGVGAKTAAGYGYFGE